jgi:hypothetical protein
MELIIRLTPYAVAASVPADCRLASILAAWRPARSGSRWRPPTIAHRAAAVGAVVGGQKRAISSAQRAASHRSDRLVVDAPTTLKVAEENPGLPPQIALRADRSAPAREPSRHRAFEGLTTLFSRNASGVDLASASRSSLGCASSDRVRHGRRQPDRCRSSP